MSVDKVILRAVLSTLAAIAALLLFMVLSLSLAFPSTMMSFSYHLGMEDTSIHFAKQAYKRSDDIYYIAYATEVAIEEEKNAKILSCGEKFIADEHFAAYTSEKGEGYGQLIYGQVSVAKYKTQDADGAIALACAGLQGGFPKSNALVSLLVSAMEAKDEGTIAKIKDKLSTLTAEGEEKVYLDSVLKAIESRRK